MTQSTTDTHVRAIFLLAGTWKCETSPR